MDALLTTLYGFGGIAASAFYVPTMLKLMRHPECWRGQSLVSWSGWIAIAFVTLAYAVRINGDPWFELVSAVSLSMEIVFVSVIVASARRHARGAKEASDAEREDRGSVVGAPVGS